MSDVTVVQTTKGHTTIHYKGKILATISGAGRTREERLELAKKMASSLEHNDSNEAAMHEALNKVGNAAAWIAESCNDQQTAKYMNDIIAIVQTAISAPQRQCDVGTPEEQTERYRKFCFAHRYLGSDFSYTCKGYGKGRCPFFNSHTKSKCEFEWAQTPYEEERKGKTDA